jgi:hypothetical protein
MSDDDVKPPVPTTDLDPTTNLGIFENQFRIGVCRRGLIGSFVRFRHRHVESQSELQSQSRDPNSADQGWHNVNPGFNGFLWVLHVRGVRFARGLHSSIESFVECIVFRRSRRCVGLLGEVSQANTGFK